MLIKNLLYIFQLENYEIGRFLRFAYSHRRWHKLARRGSLVWTGKAKFLCAISVLLIIIPLISAFNAYGAKGAFIMPALIVFLPLIIAISLLIVRPIEIYLKRKKIGKAKSVLDKYRNDLVIIGIGGSYGKTSTKEILSQILSVRYRVFMFDGNINTDIGIANAIVEEESNISRAEVLIVEMGAFRRGDLRKICGFVLPDHSILTGINEAHLERFGTLEDIIETKFELAVATKKISVLNFNDDNVRKNVMNFRIGEMIGAASKGIRIEDKENFEGLRFWIDGKRFETKLLAKHNIDLIMLCIEIAKILKISLDEISLVISKLDYASHRLELIKNNGVFIIDDSYNGNIKGFESGIEVLGRAKDRKIALTPGLVEQGGRARELHMRIGRLYARNKVDLVMLIRNSVSGYIIEGMESGGANNYRIYESASEAHADLANILKPGDTIIFQNDWTDNYF